jgi:hypothetical protein
MLPPCCPPPPPPMLVAAWDADTIQGNGSAELHVKFVRSGQIKKMILGDNIAHDEDVELLHGSYKFQDMKPGGGQCDITFFSIGQAELVTQIGKLSPSYVDPSNIINPAQRRSYAEAAQSVDITLKKFKKSSVREAMMHYQFKPSPFGLRLPGLTLASVREERARAAASSSTSSGCGGSSSGTGGGSSNSVGERVPVIDAQGWAFVPSLTSVGNVVGMTWRATGDAGAGYYRDASSAAMARTAATACSAAAAAAVCASLLPARHTGAGAAAPAVAPAAAPAPLPAPRPPLALSNYLTNYLAQPPPELPQEPGWEAYLSPRGQVFFRDPAGNVKWARRGERFLFYADEVYFAL